MRLGIAVLAGALGVALLAPRCFCRAEPNPEPRPHCPACPTRESDPKPAGPDSSTGWPHQNCACHCQANADLASPGSFLALPLAPVLEITLVPAALTVPADLSPLAIWLDSRGPPRPARTRLYLVDRHLIL